MFGFWFTKINHENLHKKEKKKRKENNQKTTTKTKLSFGFSRYFSSGEHFMCSSRLPDEFKTKHKSKNTSFRMFGRCFVVRAIERRCFRLFFLFLLKFSLRIIGRVFGSSPTENCSKWSLVSHCLTGVCVAAQLLPLVARWLK